MVVHSGTSQTAAQHPNICLNTIMAMWNSPESYREREGYDPFLGIDLDSKLAEMPQHRQEHHIRNNIKIFRNEDKARFAAHAIARASFEAGDEWTKHNQINALRFAFSDKAFTSEACMVMELLSTKHIEYAKVHFERMTWWDSRAASLTKGSSDSHVIDRFHARQIMSYVAGATIRALDACLARRR